MKGNDGDGQTEKGEGSSLVRQQKGLNEAQGCVRAGLLFAPLRLNLRLLTLATYLLAF